jgi:hypothetical protein
MPIPLKQSTTVTLRVGPFIDISGTEKTGLTPTFEVSKAHGAFGARSSATAPTHDSNGWYTCELNTTDTGTLGLLRVKSDDSANHLPVWHDFDVLAANVYDAMVAASDKLQVDLTEWIGVVPLALIANRPDVNVQAWSGAFMPAINVEVDAALNTAIPGSPTADSVNERLKTLDDNYTAARAALLDKLNISGNVASSAEVTAIQNNTRVVRVVPDVIERPDSGTQTYRVELLLYDDVGNMEAPDSAPTIELVNQAGTDRSSRLDSVTMALVETGRYRAIYTASVGDAIEQLVWTFSVVEGGATRKYGNASLIVDTTAVDFTAADRTKLDTLHDTRIPGVIQPQTGDSFARLGGPAGASVSADIAAVNGDTAAIKAKTDPLPANPASQTNLDVAVSTRATPAQVRTEANGALVDNHLDHLLAVDTDAPVGAAGAILRDMLEESSDAWRFNASALSQAPAGGGGGSVNITLGPVVASKDPGNRIMSPVKLEMWQHENRTFDIAAIDADGNPVSFTGKTLRFIVGDTQRPPVEKIQVDMGASGIVITGTNGTIARVRVNSTQSQTAADDYHWHLWSLDDPSPGERAVYAHGEFIIQPASTPT